MINVTMTGASGHFAGALWVLMFIGLPILAYRMGRSIGHDEGRWEAEDETVRLRAMEDD